MKTFEEMRMENLDNFPDADLLKDFQKLLEPFGLSVDPTTKSSWIQFDNFDKVFREHDLFYSRSVPIRGNHSIMRALHDAGIHTETYQRTGMTGRKYYVFKAQKEYTK